MVTQTLANMKSLLFLFALLGAAFAFTPQKQYYYYYTAETSVGVPGIAPTYSIVGMRANVSIQVVNEEKLLIALTQVQVAVDMSKVRGGMKGRPTDIRYTPINGEARALEEPFEVYYRREKDVLMNVPKTDREWLTNIRKSIANIVRVYPIIKITSIKQSASRIYPEFRSQENTLFGVCECHYTVKNISHQYLPMPNNIRSPSQGQGYDVCSKGAFNVTRSINFDRCRDRSMFQYTGLANRTTGAHMRHGTMESRTSVSYYTICGREGQMQIQNMTNMEMFDANPFGYETEKLQAMSNQTFRLSYIRPIAKQMVMANNKPVKSWIMAMASPYKKSPVVQERPWVNFYNNGDKYEPYVSENVVTGQVADKEQVYKTNILAIIKRVADILHQHPNPSPNGDNNKIFDTDESEVPKLMNIASRSSRYLRKEALKEMWVKLKGERSKTADTERVLYTDSLAAAGSSASISLLLDMINDNDVTNTRAVTLFMTLTNNIVNPDIIPEVVEFVKNVSIKEKPYFAIMANVNAASLLRRSCTDTKISTYSVPQPILGERRCNPSGVLKNYWKYLQQQLKQSEKTFERTAWVEAISNLGTIQALPVLKEVIAGHLGRNASIRVIGLYGLLHYRIPDAPRYEISKILTPIYEDFMEDLQLRQTAVLVHASWHPEESFWTSLATLAWRDPSKEMGSFIYSLISSTSKSTNPRLLKQAEYASLALNKAKPYPPSLMRSFSYLWARLSPTYHLSTNFDFTKISTNESSIPREVFAYLYNANGGLDYTVMEQIAMSFNADEIIFRAYERLNTAYSQVKNNPRLTRPMQYSDFLKIIKDELKFSGKTVYPYQLFYIMRLYDHVELFAPIDEDLLNRLPKHGESLIQLLLKGGDMEVVKYMNPGCSEMYFPLGNAFPIAYRLAYPIVSSWIGNVKLRIPNVQNPQNMDLFTASEVELAMTKQAKFMSSYISNIAVLVPWQKQEVFAETYMTTNYNDPSDLKLSLINSVSDDYVNSTMSMDMRPSSEKPYPIIHNQNLPIIGVRSMYPERSDERIQKLYVSPENRPLDKSITPFRKTIFGIGGYLKYQADIPYPFTVASLYESLRNPQNMMRSSSGTTKRWDYELVIDPSQSDTRTLNVSVTIWTPTTVLSLPMKNYTHVKEQSVDHTRDYPYGVSARVDLIGRVHRYFNASIGIAEVFDKQYIKDYAFRLTAHRSPLPGYSSQKGAFCLNMTTSSPNIYNFPQMVQFMSQEPNVEAVIRGEIFSGETCRQNRLGDFHGKLRMSRAEKSRIQKTVNRNGDYTPYDPIEPYYDQSDIVVNYENNKMSKLVQNATYMVYDALRGMAFPHISFAYTNVRNTPNKIKLIAKRLIETHRWNGSLELPTETARFESQVLPRMTYNVVPSAGIAPMSHECIINRQRVITFDEVRYELPAQQLAECWTVAAINKKYPERLQILVRRPSSGYEVMISSSDRQTNVEVHKNKVVINGKQVQVTDQAKWIRDPRGVKFAQVVSQWGKTEVSIPGNVTVSVCNMEISIVPFKTMYGKVNGLCGDFNTETEKEMVGPENCIYRNMTLFGQSWATSQGQSCDKSAWKQVQANVQQFQRTCAKAYPVLKQWELKKEEKDCETFVYPIVETEYVLCVSTNSVGMCLPGCKEIQYVTTDEYYYCYLYSEVPADVKPYISRGYLTHFPESLPDVTQEISTRGSFICQ